MGKFGIIRGGLSLVADAARELPRAGELSEGLVREGLNLINCAELTARKAELTASMPAILRQETIDELISKFFPLQEAFDRLLAERGRIRLLQPSRHQRDLKMLTDEVGTLNLQIHRDSNQALVGITKKIETNLLSHLPFETNVAHTASTQAFGHVLWQSAHSIKGESQMKDTLATSLLKIACSYKEYNSMLPEHANLVRANVHELSDLMTKFWLPRLDEAHEMTRAALAVVREEQLFLTGCKRVHNAYSESYQLSKSGRLNYLLRESGSTWHMAFNSSRLRYIDFVDLERSLTQISK